MFGFRIVTKRELIAYNTFIQDLRDERIELKAIAEKERNRADAAINMLLAKTQNAILTPTDPRLQKDLEDTINKNMQNMNIFDDEDEQEKTIERIQADGRQ